MTLPRYLEDDDEPTVPVAAHCASEIDDGPADPPMGASDLLLFGVIYGGSIAVVLLGVWWVLR